MQAVKMRLFAMALILALIAPIIAACSGGRATQPTAAPTAPNDGGLPEVNPSTVTGRQ